MMSRTEPSVRLLAVGDVMLGDSSHFLGRGVGSSIVRRGAPWPFAEMLPLLAEADVFFCNLESPMSASPGISHMERMYRAPFAAAAALRVAPQTCISLANNHVLEHGRPVLEETERALRENGIRYAGYSASADNGGPLVLTIGNLSISFHCESVIAGRNTGPIDEATVTERLENSLRRMPGDFAVVSLHWGDEYLPYPAPGQRKLARHLIDIGAHVVLGHHPHVLQPVEEYGGGLIAYSLGNFVFDHAWSTATRTGGVLDIRLGRARITSWTFHPTLTNSLHQPVLLHGAPADQARRAICDLREIDQEAYDRLVVSRSRSFRLRMLWELVKHPYQVSGDTWRYLASKQRRRLARLSPFPDA